MRLPRFRLGTLLYIVTAICVELAVDGATVGTKWNDRAGGAVIWGAVILWFYLRHRRKYRQARQGGGAEQAAPPATQI